MDLESMFCNDPDYRLHTDCVETTKAIVPPSISEAIVAKKKQLCYTDNQQPGSLMAPPSPLIYLTVATTYKQRS